MSEPKRYTPAFVWDGFFQVASTKESKDGEFVLHSDYAALVQQGIRDHGDWRSKLNFLEADYKAEVARLTAENERLRQPWVKILTESENWKTLSENAQLRAENERLRRAGDAMMVRLLLAIGGVADSTIEAWNDAKEGSDA